MNEDKNNMSNKKDSNNIHPFLIETSNKLVMTDFKYPIFYELFRKQQSVIWFSDHIDSLIPTDIKEWNFGELSKNDDAKRFIKYVLAFFAASDGIVNENLAKRFCSEIQLPELCAFYAIQQFIETVHSIVYANLLKAFVSDEKEFQTLKNSIKTTNSIRKKANWARKWTSSDRPFEDRVIAFAVVEGIFFSGSFCAIFWLKRKYPSMPALYLSNEYISRDEGLHTYNACVIHLISVLEKFPHANEKTIHSIIKEAVEIEKEFIEEALPEPLVGMNSKLMGEYIEYVADKLCNVLDIKIIYGTKLPFDWMENMCVIGKNNFFEKKYLNILKVLQYWIVKMIVKK